MRRPTVAPKPATALLLFSAVLLAEYSYPAAGAVSSPFTTVINDGAAAPQLPGNTIDGSGAILTDNSGSVLISASYHATGSSNSKYAIWSGSVGALRLLANQGAAAPGTGPGIVYGPRDQVTPAFERETGASAGGISAFEAYLNGTGITTSNNLGLWAGSPGNVQLVARTGSHAPGLVSGITFSSLDQYYSVNSNRVAAFQGQVQGAGISSFVNDDGIWEGAPGLVQLVAQVGTQAPGVGAGTTFAYFGSNAFFSPALNDAGTVAFIGGLSGTGVPGLPNSGIWMGTPGSLQLIARAGAAAPGTSGAVFGSLASSNISNVEPVLDNLGNLAFRADLASGDSTNQNNFGIFAWSGNSLKLVARAGASAPGIAGAAFGSPSSAGSFSQPSLSGGKIAFQCAVRGPGITLDNNLGIWAGTLGSYQLVARSGQHAPGTAAGVVFGSDSGAGCFEDPIINSLGEVAFLSVLLGPGVDSTNYMGLFATDPNGNLSLVMRFGDQYDLGGGNLRTINGIGVLNDLNFIASNADGINDLGQLSVELSFTDNTRALVLAALPVPEPAGWIPMATGAAALMLFWNRRSSRSTDCPNARRCPNSMVPPLLHVESAFRPRLSVRGGERST
jgi:hypothetical protein